MVPRTITVTTCALTVALIGYGRTEVDSSADRAARDVRAVSGFIFTFVLVGAALSAAAFMERQYVKRSRVRLLRGLRRAALVSFGVTLFFTAFAVLLFVPIGVALVDHTGLTSKQVFGEYDLVMDVPVLVVLTYTGYLVILVTLLALGSFLLFFPARRNGGVHPDTGDRVWFEVEALLGLMGILSAVDGDHAVAVAASAVVAIVGVAHYLSAVRYPSRS